MLDRTVEIGPEENIVIDRVFWQNERLHVQTHNIFIKLDLQRSGKF